MVPVGSSLVATLVIVALANVIVVHAQYFEDNSSPTRTQNGFPVWMSDLDNDKSNVSIAFSLLLH